MTKLKKWAFISVAFIFVPLRAMGWESPIAPPNVGVVDRLNNVNVATMQVQKTIQTVGIGGDMGLHHTIDIFGELYTTSTFHGFIDKFDGTAKYQAVTRNYTNISSDLRSIYVQDPSDNSEHYLYVMRVYGPVGNQDFVVYKNGGIVKNAYGKGITGYEYRAVGDSRHRLTEDLDKRYLIWTTPDGTQSKYDRGTSGYYPADGFGFLREITYPNGLKIRIDWVGNDKSISTNTGYILKYKFKSVGWNTPEEVVAINRAHQYCSTGSETCASNGWPKASFHWPINAPQVFKQPGLPLSNYLFQIHDQNGGITEVQYEPKNVCLTNSNDPNSESPYCITGTNSKWSPRIVSIKNPGSEYPNNEYRFKNNGSIQSNTSYAGSYGFSHTYWSLDSKIGLLTSAKHNGGSWAGYPSNTSHPGYIVNEGYGGSQITVQLPKQYPGVLDFVKIDKVGTYYYHPDLRRFVRTFVPVEGGGPVKYYTYEGPRGNLNRINGPNGVILSEATYDNNFLNSCPLAKAKICNSPISVTDARGNATTYEYDPEGRFAAPIKITEPADRNNVHKITYYKYEAHKASYKNSAESFVDDDSAIWLLTEEHTCRTSTANTTGCAAGDKDMIKTKYYYGPKQNSGAANNLHLRGKSITAEGNNDALETRVWCHEYDKFGNMIGETQPKGNSTDLETCP